MLKNRCGLCTPTFVDIRDGWRSIDDAAADGKTKALIEVVGSEFEALADPAKQGAVTHDQFELLLGALHELGFFPEMSAVAAVARIRVTAAIQSKYAIRA